MGPIKKTNSDFLSAGEEVIVFMDRDARMVRATSETKNVVTALLQGGREMWNQSLERIVPRSLLRAVVPGKMN